MRRAVDQAEARSGECTALLRTKFFIEPPPGYTAKKKTRRREKGVTKGSYLLLCREGFIFLPCNN
jgi:hypothetical protein